MITRGRPRSTEADAAIVRATLELLVEDGYRALSVEAVARRAGVGKATIYRRHRSKQELVAAAIRHVHADMHAPEDTGSLTSDFATMTGEVATAGGALAAMTFMPRMLAEAAGDPELHAIFTEQLVEPRRAALRTLLERAQARGEVRDDVDIDIAMDLIAGSMVYRLLLGGIELEDLPARAATVLTTALVGLRPR